MKSKIGFKSYCWAVGTTSYRTDNFNMNIEKHLELMQEFRNMEDHSTVKWKANSAFQKKYYEYLKEKNFITGNARRPQKDAREKTSGLVDIGLLDEDRNLTEAGRALLDIALSGDFSSDNLLEIPKDSFVYFRQMLKTYNKVEQSTVRPFIVFLYVLSQTEYLTYEEFTYLLPLCMDPQTTEDIINEIVTSRKTGFPHDKVILHVLMKKSNYKEALKMLQSEPVTEDLIRTVGMNRKSKNYDKPYYKIYTILKDIVFHKDIGAAGHTDGRQISKFPALEFYEAVAKLKNPKVRSGWRKYFFETTARSAIKKRGLAAFSHVPIFNALSEQEFNREFFEIMHLMKAKATLSDYFDLNRRYFKATDTVIFQDRRVTLDVLPRCYIEGIADKLIHIAFEETELLPLNVGLAEIHPYFGIDAAKLYEKLGRIAGRPVTDSYSARKVIRDERYERFNKLIDGSFSKETLLHLLTCFEERQDDEIRAKVTDNAAIPTIFEYILGVAWYQINGRQGNVLDYMNLSLEADLLPKTHAGGGEADIVWKYQKSKYYPGHTLLLEATLADGSNQRRMEMEPVSRHLGEHCLANREDKAYCIFVTTNLNMNVISDFRGRRFMLYYNKAGTDYVEGLKILPIETSELKLLLKSGMNYGHIYQILEKAYFSTQAPREWYENSIAAKIAGYGEANTGDI